MVRVETVHVPSLGIVVAMMEGCMRQADGAKGVNGLSPEVTLLLDRWGDGDRAALNDIFPMVYAELRLVARSYVSGANEHTLQATALVNEVYLRMNQGVGRLHFNDREHFFRGALMMMRHLLLDHARQRSAQKRGGDLKDTLHEGQLGDPCQLDQDSLMALEEAMDHLARRFPRKAQLVALRFYLGLSLAEAAEAVGISLASAKRDWNEAKKRLYLELSRPKHE